MATSKYRPIMKPELHRPLAPSVTCGDSSLPEGAIFRQLLRFHIGFLRIGSACCGIPQSKIKDFCQLPLAREPLVQALGFSLLRTQYHLVVEVQAVNLRLTPYQLPFAR